MQMHWMGSNSASSLRTQGPILPALSIGCGVWVPALAALDRDDTWVGALLFESSQADIGEHPVGLGIVGVGDGERAGRDGADPAAAGGELGGGVGGAGKQEDLAAGGAVGRRHGGGGSACRERHAAGGVAAPLH